MKKLLLALLFLPFSLGAQEVDTVYKDSITVTDEYIYIPQYYSMYGNVWLKILNYSGQLAYTSRLDSENIESGFYSIRTDWLPRKEFYILIVFKEKSGLLAFKTFVTS